MVGCLAQPWCSREELGPASIFYARLCWLPVVLPGLTLSEEWIGGRRRGSVERSLERKWEEKREGRLSLVCKINKKKFKKRTGQTHTHTHTSASKKTKFLKKLLNWIFKSYWRPIYFCIQSFIYHSLHRCVLRLCSQEHFTETRVLNGLSGGTGSSDLTETHCPSSECCTCSYTGETDRHSGLMPLLPYEFDNIVSGKWHYPQAKSGSRRSSC